MIRERPSSLSEKKGNEVKQRGASDVLRGDVESAGKTIEGNDANQRI